MSGSYTLERTLGSGAKDSIANASQLFAIDRTILSNRAAKLAPKRLA